jgi:6,7-dimethyl-8-ribityllumazine synthase
MNPVVALRNLTPSSTAELSLTVTVAGTAVLAQMVQGQADVLVPVVNDQEKGAMVLPLGSRAPVTVAVCTVDAASVALGVKVTVRVGAS